MIRLLKMREEYMEKVSGAECLDGQLRKILRKHFKHCASEYDMTLILLQENVSYADNSIKELTDEIVSTDEKYLCKEVKEVADHRITSDGSRKKLYWIMTSRKKCETNIILAKIILEELIPKFNDLVIIEDLKKLEGLCDLERENKICFFFGNLLKQNWLINTYAERVFSEYELPERESLIRLSAMTYEKSLVKTKLFFSQDEIPRNMLEAVYFQYKDREAELVRYKSEELRAVRKLMEVSDDKSGLWIRLPGYEIEGSILEESIKCNETRIVCVEFEGPYVWSIRKSNENILKYHDGSYAIPCLQPEKDQDAELEKVKEYLEKFKLSDKIKNICDAIKNVRNICKHGTSIIFIDQNGIEKEIDDRLAKNKRAFRIKELSLVNSIPKGITTIDGALISDLDGNCCAIGVIVDGEIIVKGDYGRGARYNSINNYVQIYRNKYPNKICIAVVISEDGMLNIIVGD